MRFDKAQMAMVAAATEGKDAKVRIGFPAGGSVEHRLTRPNKMFGLKYEVGKYERKMHTSFDVTVQIGRYDGDRFIKESEIDLGECRTVQAIEGWTQARIEAQHKA